MLIIPTRTNCTPAENHGMVTELGQAIGALSHSVLSPIYTTVGHIPSQKAILMVKIIRHRIQFGERKYKTFGDLELS